MPGQVMHQTSPMLLCSTGVSQTAFSFFHHFCTKASPFWPICRDGGARYVLYMSSLPSASCHHCPCNVDAAFRSSYSWNCGSTHSLTGFFQRKRKTSVLARTKKISWILFAISRNLLWQDHKSRKLGCFRKKKCSSLWWTVSDKVKANSDYSICIMALFQRLEGGYPTLWKSMELATDRGRWNLMRLKTKFITASCIWEQSFKQKLTWKLVSVWTPKEGGMFLGGVWLGVFISDLARS